MLARDIQMSTARDFSCSHMLKPQYTVSCHMYCACVDRGKGKMGEGGKKVIIKVLSGSVPYCKQDQSNFEVGKETSENQQPL